MHRPFSARTFFAVLSLGIAGQSAFGAAPPLTWDQCHERGGESVSGKSPLTCPEGQHQIGRITNAHCTCICCAPTGQATESRILYGLPAVETKDGKRSVWGIKLRLSSPLQNPIKPEQVSIVESKHGRELRRSMDFHLKDRGAELEIIFKPGKGDFGSGNSVHVEISSGTLLANGKQSTKTSSTDMSTDLP